MISYVLAIMIAATLPFILFYPFLGILAWFWIGYMNPHRLIWGFGTEISWAMIIGVTALIAFALSREPKRLPVHTLTVLLGIFAIWMSVTTYFAAAPAPAFQEWDQVMKILLMVFVAMALMTTRERIHAVVWVVVIAVGFFGVKGGIWMLLTGGQDLVRGPPDSFIGSRNTLAMALITVLPLIRYLQLHTESRPLRIALMGAFALNVFAVVGTHSRGALVALVIVGISFVLISRHRFQMAAIGLVLGVAVIAVVPQHWVERMYTIETYEEDGSASSRLAVWEGNFNLTLDRPIFGAGFRHYYNSDLYFQYTDDTATRSSHSIYFQVMSEHGFVGLALFMSILLIAFLRCGSIMRMARGDPEKAWAGDLAQMIRLCLIGYASAGLFINIAYFDLFYNLLALIVASECIVRRGQLTAREARLRSRSPQLGSRQSEGHPPDPAPEPAPAAARFTASPTARGRRR